MEAGREWTRVAGSDGKSLSVVSGEAGAKAGSCDILPGFGTFTAAAIINIVPTETSLGSGVNTCQSGSEPRRLPPYSAATAAEPRAPAPSGDILSKAQISNDSNGV